MKFLFLLCLVATNAWAVGAEVEGTSIIKKADLLFEDNSANNRIEKRGLVTAQLVGYGPTATPTEGIAAGYYLNSNSLIYAEYMGLRTGDEQQFGTSYQLDVSSFGVHYKQFFANSFYVQGGIDQRRISYDYRYTTIYPADYASRSFGGQSTVASVAIGNQWQWQTFTLGCDWVGFHGTLASNVESEKITGNLADDWEKDRLEDDKKRFVTGNSISLLRFYLGASF